MSRYTPHPITQTPQELCEGPFWDCSTLTLYYVDLFAGDINKVTNLASGAPTVTEKAHIDGSISIAIPVANQENQLVIAEGYTKRLYKYDWDTGVYCDLGVKVEEGQSTRFNDGKCDPRGRLWIGTMGLEKSPAVLEAGLGSLYKVDGRFGVEKQCGKITLSNGMAWCDKKMFFADSVPGMIYGFDYDDEEGRIANQQVVFDFTKNTDVKTGGIPDGMTVDFNGKLWVACYNGGRVACIDPEIGKIIDSIKFPVDKITSVCFGGDRMNELYVTSAYKGLTPEEMKAQPLAGCVFKVDLDVQGALSVPFSFTS